MRFSLLPPFSLSVITKFFFFLIFAITPQAVDHEYYSECSKPCACKSITEIKYPFWGSGRPSYCGLQGYEVICEENTIHPTFIMSSQWFFVLNINRPSFTMKISREDLFGGICPSSYIDTTINSDLVEDSPFVKNITLFYKCDPDILGTVQHREKLDCDDGIVTSNKLLSNSTFLSEASTKCKNKLMVPVMQEDMTKFEEGSLELVDLVRNGFEVSYELQAKMLICRDCEESGGICGTNTATNVFACFCKDGPRDFLCPGKSNVRRNIGIAFAAVGGFFLIAGLAFFALSYRNKKGKHVVSSWESRDISSYGSSVLDLEKSSSYYGVQVFEYNDLQEATNNFDEERELGDGGFGIVYKGNLRDGRVVAVKRLYERNFKRVEQFKNEVDILAKLRHKNLVTLYGCTSRSSRELLLVYEYVCNGTVADHLHGTHAKPGSLSWTTRMSIAVETANALSFLHNSDVIHRDVKTNNILLDENFVVKVADFGLSRLYPNNVTHVSTAPQGTPGYVDPEYHQCYRLTDKSDVYSFGVVLIELISSMPAVDITRHRHDINLSNMAVDKIQNHALSEIVDPYLGFDSNFKVRKMVSGVAELAFRCLQNGRDMRPSMEEVLEILKNISRENYAVNIVEQMEITGGGDVLIKSDPPTVSSGSTSSYNTTPSTSS